MAHPDLTSHHVNYLIWRYLQESGHGEAAVTLQRAWNRDPQSLPFAPHIKTHALVSLVQKGLQYHELEHSFDKDGNPISFSPSDYFFGSTPLEPETLKSQSGPAEAAGTDQPPASPPTKITREEDAINGHLTAEPAAPQPASSVQKPRKSDRAEANGDEVSMDVDANGGVNDSQAAVTESPSQPDTTVDRDGDVSMGIRPSSQPQEPPVPPTTLENGHSVAVQITPAKAADLSPNTAILDVAGDSHVTRTLWRPHDPTVVVTAGDTFCSLWKLSSFAAPVQEKLVESKENGACVSAVSWNPTGQKLAVATYYNDVRGSITMYDVDGHAVDLLPEVPRMITGMHWMEGGSHLIVVASDAKISELALWDDSLRPEEFPPPQVIDGSIFDLCWLGRNQAFACGTGAVYQCDVDSSIRIAKAFSSAENDRAWSFIRGAYVGSTPVAVAASSEHSALWVPTHDLHLDQAHEGEITAIELQPNASDPSQTSPHLVLASSATDGTIKVWRIDLESRRFDCIHQLSLGSSSAALASTFSPDGYALAAAGADRLLIWNAQRGGTAMATWTVPGSAETKKEEQSPTANGHHEPLPDRTLTWDTDGKKLAFGFGHQIAIINLQH
ncbi:WD40 repeat-like protein [Aspergillus candidus]|uniref:WD40 repeat-like protein n=1 Tax=Aspergillus candidus TaxID=41067 RepID=A0A2I2F1P1_ASPCN|nr:WD40 repeat-like protein [Aspergillus candidus]PLB34539.1 WD40 repeat-like protein [Aspergillus candidus]